MKTAYETKDVDFWTVIKSAAGLLGILIAVCIAAKLLFNLTGRQKTEIKIHSSAIDVPPEPRLQTQAPEDLAALHREEDSVLNHYGWVDRDRGIIRIPIQEAIKILSERGLPARQSGGKGPS